MLKNKKLILFSIFLLMTGMFLGNKMNLETNAMSYGKTVAIVNDDVTQEYEGEDLNFASYAIDILEDTRKYNFDIVSKTKADEGISNDYYIAAIQFPSDFSRSILTVNQKNPNQAKVEYEINKKISSEYQAEILFDIQYYFYILNNCINYIYTYGIFEGIHKSQNYIEDIKENNDKSIELFEELLELRLLDGYDFSYDDMNLLGIGEEITGYQDITSAYIEENKDAINDFTNQYFLKENFLKLVGENGYIYFQDSFEKSQDNIIDKMNNVNEEISELDISIEYNDLYKSLDNIFDDIFELNSGYNKSNLLERLENYLDEVASTIGQIINNPSNLLIENEFLLSRLEFERNIGTYVYCINNDLVSPPGCQNMETIKLNATTSLKDYNDQLKKHAENINNLYMATSCKSDCEEYINNYLNSTAGNSSNEYPVFADEFKIIEKLNSIQYNIESFDVGEAIFGNIGEINYFENNNNLDNVCIAYYVECPYINTEAEVPVLPESKETETTSKEARFKINEDTNYLMYKTDSGENKRVVSSNDEVLVKGQDQINEFLTGNDTEVITINEIFGGVCTGEDESSLFDKACTTLDELVYKHNSYGKQNENISISLKWIFEPNYQEIKVEEGEKDLSFINPSDITSDSNKTEPSSIYADIFGYYYCDNGGNYSYAEKSGEEYTCSNGEVLEVPGINTIFEEIPIFKTILDYIFGVSPEQKEVDEEKYYNARGEVNSSVDSKLNNNKEQLSQREQQITEDINEIKNDENYQNTVHDKIKIDQNMNNDSNDKLEYLDNLMLNTSDEGVNNTKVYEFISNPIKTNYEGRHFINIEEGQRLIVYFIILLLILAVILFLIIKIWK